MRMIMRFTKVVVMKNQRVMMCLTREFVEGCLCGDKGVGGINIKSQVASLSN